MDIGKILDSLKEGWWFDNGYNHVYKEHWFLLVDSKNRKDFSGFGKSYEEAFAQAYNKAKVFL